MSDKHLALLLARSDTPGSLLWMLTLIILLLIAIAAWRRG